MPIKLQPSELNMYIQHIVPGSELQRPKYKTIMYFVQKWVQADKKIQQPVY